VTSPPACCCTKADGENHFHGADRAARAALPSGAIVPREYVFVLDVSGSMHGFPLATAKTLLRYAGVEPEAPAILSSSSRSLPVATRCSHHVRCRPPRENIAAPQSGSSTRRKGRGSTELLAALKRALALPAEVGSCAQFRHRSPTAM
jgi:Ca-activated chloride channel homolog